MEGFIAPTAHPPRWYLIPSPSVEKGVESAAEPLRRGSKLAYLRTAIGNAEIKYNAFWRAGRQSCAPSRVDFARSAHLRMSL